MCLAEAKESQAGRLPQARGGPSLGAQLAELRFETPGQNGELCRNGARRGLGRCSDIARDGSCAGAGAGHPPHEPPRPVVAVEADATATGESFAELRRFAGGREGGLLRAGPGCGKRVVHDPGQGGAREGTPGAVRRFHSSLQAFDAVLEHLRPTTEAALQEVQLQGIRSRIRSGSLKIRLFCNSARLRLWHRHCRPPCPQTMWTSRRKMPSRGQRLQSFGEPPVASPRT